VTLDWSIIALLLALLGQAAFVLGARSAEMGLRKPSAHWLLLLVQGAGLTVLAGMGGRLAGDTALSLAGVCLPLMFVALVTWVADGLGDRPRWARMLQPTIALSLMIALLCSLVGSAAAAFVIIGLLAFMTVAFQLLHARAAAI
jgi:hypothetical protein